MISPTLRTLQERDATARSKGADVKALHKKANDALKSAYTTASYSNAGEAYEDLRTATESLLHLIRLAREAQVAWDDECLLNVENAVRGSPRSGPE